MKPRARSPGLGEALPEPALLARLPGHPWNRGGGRVPVATGPRLGGLFQALERMLGKDPECPGDPGVVPSEQSAWSRHGRLGFDLERV